MSHLSPATLRQRRITVKNTLAPLKALIANHSYDGPRRGGGSGKQLHPPTPQSSSPTSSSSSSSSSSSASDGVVASFQSSLNKLLVSNAACGGLVLVSQLVMLTCVAVLYYLAESLSSNPPTFPATYQDGHSRASHVWACLTLCGTLFMIFSTPSKKQRLSFIVLSIFSTCFVHYSLLASRMLPVWHDIRGHELYPIRYVQWMCTTPLMIMMLCNLTPQPLKFVAWTVAGDVLMLITGFLSIISSDFIILVIMFLISSTLAGFTMLRIHKICQDYRHQVKEHVRMQNSILFLQIWLTLLYTAIPVVWVLSLLSYLDDEQTCAAYYYVETIGKSVYCCPLLIINFDVLDHAEELDHVKQSMTQAYNQRKKDLLRHFLHEIRVALNIVGLTLPNMEEMFENDQSSPMVQYIEEIRTAADHITMVLDSVLSYSKVSENQVSITKASCSLQQVLHQAIQIMTPLADRFKIRIRCIADEYLPNVESDTDHLRHVIVHFLSNAILFQPPIEKVDVGEVLVVLQKCRPFDNLDPVVKHEKYPDNPLLQISPSSHSVSPSQIDHRQPLFLRISVRDRGVGIDGNDLKRMFKPFVHIHAGEEIKGRTTSLSLAICNSLVSRLGGRIGVVSHEGFGSEFFFEIGFDVSYATSPGILTPLASPIETTPTPTTRLATLYELKNQIERTVSSPATTSVVPVALPAIVDTPNLPLRRLVAPNNTTQVPRTDRILVVDDQELNRKLLARGVEKRLPSVKCIMAKDGQDAIDKIQQHGVSAFITILCDKEMPVMDGYVAVREMRRMNVRCPILGVTANALDEDRREFMKCGLNGLITKPVDMELLIDTVCSECLAGGVVLARVEKKRKTPKP